MSFARWAVIATTFAVFSGCRAASAPVSAPAMRPDSGAFVVTLGNDTVSAESFRKTGDRIQGVVVRRVPRTSVLRYVLTLAPSGLPKRLEYNSRMASGEMFPGGARAVIVTFTPDSAITEIHRDSVVTVRVMAPNAYPDIDGSVSLYALPIGALRTADRDSGRFVAYAAGASRGEAASVARKDAGRYYQPGKGWAQSACVGTRWSFHRRSTC